MTGSDSGHPLSCIDSATVSAVGAGSHTDSRRPLLLGYLHKHLFTTQRQLGDAQEGFEHFARLEGFDLRAVYVEEIETAPAAFERLVHAVDRVDVAAIALPSLLHFAVLGSPASIKCAFEHLTGARVLIAATSSRPAGVPDP